AGCDGIFFFSSRRRHTRFSRDWSSDVCSSDLTYELDNTLAATQALSPSNLGTETFSYTVKDRLGATSTSTLTITVNGTNDQPVITSAPAAALGTVTEQGTANPLQTNTVSGTITASDVDTGDTKTWSIAETQGLYGSIAI